MPVSMAATRAKPEVIRCNCKHDFQDTKYGPGMRLMNPTSKQADAKGGPTVYRCTVCSQERGRAFAPIAAAPVGKKKK